jgi:hypothetical protein
MLCYPGNAAGNCTEIISIIRISNSSRVPNINVNNFQIWTRSPEIISSSRIPHMFATMFVTIKMRIVFHHTFRRYSV